MRESKAKQLRKELAYKQGMEHPNTITRQHTRRIYQAVKVEYKKLPWNRRHNERNG